MQINKIRINFIKSYIDRKIKVYIIFIMMLFLIVSTIGCRRSLDLESVNLPEKEIVFNEESYYDDKYVKIEPIKIKTQEDEIRISLRINPSEKLLKQGFNEVINPRLHLKVSKDGVKFQELNALDFKHEVRTDEKGDYSIYIYKVKGLEYKQNTKFRLYFTGASSFKDENRHIKYNINKKFLMNSYKDLGSLRIRNIEEIDRKQENIYVKFEFITKGRHPIVPFFSLIKGNGEKLELKNYAGYSTYEQGLVEGRTYYFESKSGLKGESELTLHVHKLKMNLIYTSNNKCFEFEI